MHNIVYFKKNVVVPKKAKYIATDKDGMIYWFSKKPKLFVNYEEWRPDEMSSEWGFVGTINIDDWQNSLMRLIT